MKACDLYLSKGTLAESLFKLVTQLNTLSDDVIDGHFFEKLIIPLNCTVATD